MNWFVKWGHEYLHSNEFFSIGECQLYMRGNSQECGVCAVMEA